MNQNLAALVVLVGYLTGSGLPVYAPARGVTWADLQDAGIANQTTPVILVSREDVGPVLKSRLLDGGAVMRPNQKHTKLERQAYRTNDQTAIICPGLRWMNPALKDNTDDDSQRDIAELIRVRACASDPGFCGNGPRNVSLAPQAQDPSPCMMPNCWIGDGGTWVDDAVVDCKRNDTSPARWAGCNVIEPASAAVGTQCVPVECGVLAGEVDAL